MIRRYQVSGPGHVDDFIGFPSRLRDTPQYLARFDSRQTDMWYVFGGSASSTLCSKSAPAIAPGIVAAMMYMTIRASGACVRPRMMPRAEPIKAIQSARK